MSRCDRGGSLLLFTLAFFPPIAAIHRFVVEPCHGSVVSLATTRILIQFQIHTIHWSPSFFEIFQKSRKTFGYAHVYLCRNDGSWIYYRCLVIEWWYRADINKCFFFLFHCTLNPAPLSRSRKYYSIVYRCSRKVRMKFNDSWFLLLRERACRSMFDLDNFRVWLMPFRRMKK